MHQRIEIAGQIFVDRIADDPDRQARHAASRTDLGHRERFHLAGDGAGPFAERSLIGGPRDDPLDGRPRSDERRCELEIRKGGTIEFERRAGRRQYPIGDGDCVSLQRRLQSAAEAGADDELGAMSGEDRFTGARGRRAACSGDDRRNGSPFERAGANFARRRFDRCDAGEPVFETTLLGREGEDHGDVGHGKSEIRNQKSELSPIIAYDEPF